MNLYQYLSWASILGSTIVCCFLFLQVSPEIHRSQYIILSPAKWISLGYFFLFVLMPINHIAFNEISYDTFDYLIFAPFCCCCFISILFYAIGWIFVPWNYFDNTKESNRKENETLSRYAYLSLLAPSAIAAFLLVSAYGSFTDFLTSPANAYDKVGASLYNILSWLFSSLLVLGLLQYIKSSTRPGSYLGLLALLIYFLISIKLGARLRLLYLAMGLLAITSYSADPKLTKKIISISIPSFMIVFFIIGTIRFEFTYNSEIEDLQNKVLLQSENLYYEFFMRGDFDAFENGMQLMNIEQRTQEYFYGSTLFSVFYNPIPRVLWADKPSPNLVEPLFQEHVGRGIGTNMNLACSLPGELFANFSWIGVVVGMFGFGVLSKIIYIKSANNGTIQSFVKLSLYLSYSLLVLRGNFHSMTTYFLMILSWFMVYEFIQVRITLK